MVFVSSRLVRLYVYGVGNSSQLLLTTSCTWGKPLISIFHLAFTDSSIIFFAFYRQENGGLDRPVSKLPKIRINWMVLPGFTPRAVCLQNSCLSLVCLVHIIISRFYQRCVFNYNDNLKEVSFLRPPVGCLPGISESGDCRWTCQGPC